MVFASQKSETSAPAGPEGRAAWRFSLVEPGDREAERGFSDLEALVAFLRQELEAG